jgi:Protein of unknown function (DUF2924)
MNALVFGEVNLSPGFDLRLAPKMAAVGLAFRPPQSVTVSVVHVSGEEAKNVEPDVYRAIQQLHRLTIPVLTIRYQELFGEAARILHKQFLVRRLAWQLQAQVQGGLGVRACQRILEISDESDLRSGSNPARRLGPARAAISAPASAKVHYGNDPRLPPAGTLLKRHHRGRDIVVKVLEQGFEYESKRYSSLSAVARASTGTRWNGFLFFRLTERIHG